MPLIQVNDINIHYKLIGQGPVVVMLMGFTGNMNWWPDHVIEVLSQKFQLLLIDNRGTGLSERGKKSYSIPLLASDVETLVDRLNIHEAYVFGVSMGGMISQELVLTYPKRYKKLVLACSFGGIDFNKLVTKGHFHLARRYLYCKTTRSASFFSNLVFTEKYRLTAEEEELAKVSAAMNEYPVSRRLKYEQLTAIAKWRSWSRLNRISIPTLIITGNQDLLVHAGYSLRLARMIPEATFVRLPEQGHGFLYELGHEGVEPIFNFLSDPATGATDTSDLGSQKEEPPAELA